MELDGPGSPIVESGLVKLAASNMNAPMPGKHSITAIRVRDVREPVGIES